jgi:hypothetical protein
MNYKCTHKWEVDCSTALLSNPSQYRGKCTKCGATDTRTLNKLIRCDLIDNGDELFTGNVTVNATPEFTHITNHGEKCNVVLSNPDTNDVVIVMTEKGEYVRHANSSLMSIQQKHIIDMSLFVDTDVLLQHKRDETDKVSAYELREPPHLLKNNYQPVLDYWNHITGLTEKPNWLEGFEYEVKWQDIDGDFRRAINECGAGWSNVCAIKITGLADDAEYAK